MDECHSFWRHGDGRGVGGQGPGGPTAMMVVD